MAAWRLAALGALSGALYFLSFPVYSIRPLAWIALVPLVVAVRLASSRRDAMWAGSATAMLVCLGGYFWIADTAHRFWQVPWPLAVLLLGLYGTFAEIHFTLFAVLAWILKRRSPRLPALSAATLFATCEWLVPRIFPDKLAHSQLDFGPFAYAAALVGTHGLSFSMAWVAASLAAMLDRSNAPRRRMVELALAVLVALVLTGWGAHRRATLGATTAARSLDVVVVQSNIGDPEELAHSLGSITAAIDSTLATYIGLTVQAIQDQPADVVVWPETAVPSVPRLHLLVRLRALCTGLGVPLVYGAYDAERGSDKRLRLYNAAFHMQKSGALDARYAKHKLLLFGEYVPFSERFPALLDLLPTPGEFTPGPGPMVFRVAGFGLTPLICYELLFPNVVRDALRAGGEVLVNLTNDYWFGRHLEPEQHLALCRMCALETGRPIVRATNTGISALIDARGAVLARTGVWTRGVLRDRLPVPPMSWTPYARWGELTTAGLAAGAWILVGLAWKLFPASRPAPLPPGDAGPGPRA